MARPGPLDMSPFGGPILSGYTFCLDISGTLFTTHFLPYEMPHEVLVNAPSGRAMTAGSKLAGRVLNETLQAIAT